MKWSHRLQIGTLSLLLELGVSSQKIITTGVSSRISSTTYHILLLDYDLIDDDRLKEELVWLQELFKIGDFIVFETNKYGRHALCLDVLDIKTVLKIVRSSNCDETFKFAPRINPKRSWVLRFDKKGNREAPRYLYTIKSPYEGRNRQSRGHAKYLRKYGLRVKLKQPYGPREVERQTYFTTEKK